MLMMMKTATAPPIIQKEILSDQRCSELLSMLAKRGDGRETIKVLLTMMMGNSQDSLVQTTIDEDGNPSTTPEECVESASTSTLTLNDKDVLQVISMMEKNNGKETVEGLLQRIKMANHLEDGTNANSNICNSEDAAARESKEGGNSSNNFKEDTMRAIMSTASKNLPSSSKKKISPDAVYKLAFQITNSVVDSVKLGTFDMAESTTGETSSVHTSETTRMTGTGVSQSSPDGADLFGVSLGGKNNKRGSTAKRSRSLATTYNSQKPYKDGGFDLSDPMIGNVNIPPGIEQQQQQQGNHQVQQMSRDPMLSMQKNFAFNGMVAPNAMFMANASASSMSQQHRAQLMQQHLQANQISPAHARAYMNQMASASDHQYHHKPQQQLHLPYPKSPTINPSQKETFPVVLHRALLELDGVEGGSEIAMFVPNGSAFCIVDTEAFEQSVMSMYFPRLKSFSSFILQLNVYEFERLDSPLLKSKFAYFHALFHRDNAQCVSQMRPRKRKSL